MQGKPMLLRYFELHGRKAAKHFGDGCPTGTTRSETNVSWLSVRDESTSLRSLILKAVGAWAVPAQCAGGKEWRGFRQRRSRSGGV